MTHAFLLGLGLLILIAGAEVMVTGGSRLAARLGISPVVIGLTVVALGTSAPELVVGIDAVFRDSAGLAVGNIIGTNLVNILLILGLSALMLPLALESRTIRFDLPAMTVAALMLFAMGVDGRLGRLEGVLMLVAALAYTMIVVHTSRQEALSVRAEYEHGFPPAEKGSHVRRRTLVEVGMLVGGIVVIVIGGDLLVDGAIGLAEAVGVSNVLIGLTVVAIGTSAPELVTLVVSTLRHDRGIAIGNILGSSVYNILFILGTTMVVAPGGMDIPDPVRQVDLVLMTLLAVVCIPVFRRGHRMTRVEGGLFVLSYLIYLGYLLVFRS